MKLSAENTNVRRIKTQVTSGSSRSLLGYNIYRDGSLIDSVNDPLELEYLDDSGLDDGTYEYYVTAVYDDGESDPSNTEEATITLPTVQNLNGVFNSPNVVLTWTQLGASRDIEFYNVYRDQVLIGTSTSGLYVDTSPDPGTYTYNVAGVFTEEYEGPWSDDEVVEVPVGSGGILIPAVTSLNGNYPNPFNPTTTIKFGLHEAQSVVLNVYNIKGEKVRSLVNEELEAGYHDIVWDGKDDSGKTASSGVYFYKMKASKYVSTKKMIMMK
jgi:hypothetical protein